MRMSKWKYYSMCVCDKYIYMKYLLLILRVNRESKTNIHTQKYKNKSSVVVFLIFGEYIRIYIYKYQYLARNDSEARFFLWAALFFLWTKWEREIDVVWYSILCKQVEI